MNRRPIIVFMGTPDFAVPTLRALYHADVDLPLVVTQPDRPKGRGRSLAASPVKEIAAALGIPVIQPATVRDEAFEKSLAAVVPDFLVVVAFGQILPQRILQLPKHGALNVHGSLLPRYRGPAPIQWAMIRGEHETGVTTMLMDTGVDTGDIFLQARTTISAEDTAETLHQRLARMGAELLIETLNKIRNGTLFPKAQRHAEATYAPMLSKADGHINWHQRADRIDAFVRAMTPWPGAFCFLDDRRLKIYKTGPLNGISRQVEPGTVVEGFADELRIACTDGVVIIEELQGASGKRMSAAKFLRGHPVAPGKILK